MNKYKCLSLQNFEYNSYSICPLRYEDIYKIKEWRNEQIDILRQKKMLTNEGQKDYYNNIIRPQFDLKNPPQILFSFFKNKNFIGYGGLVNIRWIDYRAEVSFLVNTERTKDHIYKEDFLSYLELIKKVAFNDLDFNRIFTETYDIRDKHIAILEESGFLLEGRMKEHVLINKKFTDSLIHGFLKQ